MPIYEIMHPRWPDWLPGKLRKCKPGQRWEFGGYNRFTDSSTRFNVEIIDEDTIVHSSSSTLYMPTRKDDATASESGTLVKTAITPFALAFGPLLLWRPK